MNNASIIIGSGDCDIDGCGVYEYIGKSNSKPINVERKFIYGKVETHEEHLKLNFIKSTTFPTIQLKNETISLLIAFNNSTRPHGPNHHLMKHHQKMMVNMNFFRSSKCHVHTGDDSMMMKMYFHLDLKNIVLFSFWKTESLFGNLLTCFILFLFSFFNQFLYFIVRLKPKTYLKDYFTINQGSKENNEEDYLLNPYDQVATPNHFKISKYWFYLIKPIVLFFQSSFSYLLMLVIMTYHVGFFFSIIVGSTIGWTVFNMTSNVEPDPCCQ
jgi:hypothetical protein